MKPHIKRVYSKTFGEFIWFCRGSLSIGIGDTPELAYLNWKWWTGDKHQKKAK